MIENPHVSVIVPCYNQAEFLDEALESVLAQTYINWECIIINDGSNDNTEEVALNWVGNDCRFKYIYQANSGLSRARNAGLKIANGEYIQFLDSDDLLESEKISIQIKALVNDPEIDISVSGYRYFKDSKQELKAMGCNSFFPEVALDKNDSDIIEVLNVKNPMVISAPLYRLSVFSKVGLFDEELVSLEDWDFHTRCALNDLKFQHIGIVKASKTLIRLHSKSMMRNDETMNRGRIEFLKKRSQNPLYIKHFPENELAVKTEDDIKIVTPRIKYLKSLLKLFIPPIIIIIKRKLF